MKMQKKSYQKLFRATLATTVATGALVAAVPTFTQAAEAKAFSDVKVTHHFYEPVKELTSRGVIDGYLDGTFRPGGHISREHAAKIMALALNLDVENVKDPGFKDVSKNSPYYGHIAALVEAGIIKGYEDNTFKPKGNLTRAHMAQMLVLGYKLDAEKFGELPFTDVNDKQWFADHIQTLYKLDITTGTTPTTFSPNAFVTRGQTASFIVRTEKVADKPTTPGTGGGGVYIPGPTPKTGEQILDEKIVATLAKANQVGGENLTLGFDSSTNVFTVTINPEKTSTINTFAEDEVVKSVYNDFQSVGTVNKVTVGYRGMTVSTDDNFANKAPLSTVIEKALEEMNALLEKVGSDVVIKPETDLSVLKDKTITFEVDGEIDGKKLDKVTYTFSFK